MYTYSNVSMLIGVDEYDVSPEGRTSSALSLPMTMPLKRIGNKPIRRYEEWDEKGKDSKISKIFQLTVTALSFLAFGGYLLTLIITAIRRNQNNNNQSNVIVLSSLQKIKRPKRNLYMYDPLEYDCDVEHLYRGMIMLSSDYSSHSIKNRF
ncbi:uncharacterized protein LOC107980822 [Nasonia vitripennis]|uniref:Uncharacterized protein n=1 Tax=Nasonia vitripennis TaxID=7425 RepID=A0A7M7IP48_NASVI|nr:uncharacterized protein LOC107980822 [Nasonia vitripennis]